MAHGLHIALSGPRSYDGQLRDYPFVNDAGQHDLTSDDIDRAVGTLWKTWAAALLIAGAIAITR